MYQVKTKPKLTKEYMEQYNKEIEEKFKQEMENLNAPELTREEKEVLVGIKLALKEAEEEEGYTIEEVREFFQKEFNK